MFPFLVFVPTLLLFTYYGDVLPHCGADSIKRVITLTTSEFAVLTALQFLLYAAEGAALD